MTKFIVRVENCYSRLFSSMERALESWGRKKVKDFEREWRELEAHGAELVEVGFVGGRVVAYPSEDFTAHCAKWGIHPDA